MAIEKGTFILLDYTGRVKETGDIFDTTSEEEAKKHGLQRPGALFEPRLVVVGEGWVVKGLDDALLQMEIGKTVTVEVPPEKGLGQRDPSKMRLIPLRKVRARDITPQPGMEVEVNGRTGIIRAAGAGRVQVDFNPPLAGRTLVYDATVKAILEKPEDKIRGLLHRRIPSVPGEKFDIQIESGALKVKVPPEAFLAEGVQYAKRGVASDIEKFLPMIQEATFFESYVRPKPSPEEAKPSEQREAQPHVEAVPPPQSRSEATPAPAAEEQAAAQPKKRRSGTGSRRPLS